MQPYCLDIAIGSLQIRLTIAVSTEFAFIHLILLLHPQGMISKNQQWITGYVWCIACWEAKKLFFTLQPIDTYIKAMATSRAQDKIKDVSPQAFHKLLSSLTRFTSWMWHEW